MGHTDIASGGEIKQQLRTCFGAESKLVELSIIILPCNPFIICMTGWFVSLFINITQFSLSIISKVVGIRIYIQHIMHEEDGSKRDIVHEIGDQRSGEFLCEFLYEFLCELCQHIIYFLSYAKICKKVDKSLHELQHFRISNVLTISIRLNTISMLV